MRYPVVLHKDENSDYGVTVPDLPGCFSAGETLDEALEGAVEAIECHIEGLLIDNEPIPPMQSLDEHRQNPDYADGLWAIVTVDLSTLSGKAQRVDITLPEGIIAMMDRMASTDGETRSGFIAQATLAYIADRELEK